MSIVGTAACGCRHSALAPEARRQEICRSDAVQRGIVPIFGTDSPAHLQADLRVYAAGFKLSDDEMTAISGLNQNLSAPGYEEQMKWSQSCP